MKNRLMLAICALFILGRVAAQVSKPEQILQLVRRTND